MDILIFLGGLLIGFVLGDRQAWWRKALATEAWMANAMSFVISSPEFDVTVTRKEDAVTRSATFTRTIGRHSR